MKTSPAFLGVGPGSSGSTWLYENLVRHPDVSMPPRKEIRYFWEQHALGSPRFRDRCFGTHWHFRSERRFVRERLRQHLRSLGRGRIPGHDLVWDLKFVLGTRNDNWYRSLFEKGTVGGDISPHYFHLPEDAVARIARILPDARVLLILRDPVEREWAELRRLAWEFVGVSAGYLGHDELLRLVNRPDAPEHGCFAEALRRWQYHFPGRLQLSFFDDLRTCPVELFDEICAFLGLKTAAGAHREGLAGKVNSGPPARIPDSFRRFLIERHYQSVVTLSERVPESPHPPRWLAGYDQFLERR